jgi:hypothetical protein
VKGGQGFLSFLKAFHSTTLLHEHQDCILLGAQEASDDDGAKIKIVHSNSFLYIKDTIDTIFIFHSSLLL